VETAALGLVPSPAKCPEVGPGLQLPSRSRRTLLLAALGASGPAGCLDTGSQMQAKLREGKASAPPRLPPRLKHLSIDKFLLY